jgi:ubiquinone/menaquinone biosynthesis C-methylase UbiE
VNEDRPPICDYEGSDYQERFWDRGERAYEDRVEAIALHRLLSPGGRRLLEVGAGAGRNTERYVDFQQIVLLDYSHTQLALARDRLGDNGRYIYVAGDVYRLPFAPRVFDASTMIRTLHHMAEPLDALQEVHQVLEPGAIFILEYANKRNLKAIARWLLRRQTWSPFDHTQVEFAPLNFDFHPVVIRKMLAQAGFDISRQLTVSHFRLDLLKRLVPLDLLVTLDAMAQWSGGLFQLTPSVFVRSIATGGGMSVVEGAFWRCPVCRSLDMEQGEEGVRCHGCGRLWPVRGGIYDFKEALED